MMELFIVTSSMDWGECFTVEGVFSTEEKAEEFITEQEKTSNLHYNSFPAVLDIPRF